MTRVANLRAVEDQEPWRLVDEDRRALPPSLPYEPGHEDARAEEEKESKVT